MVNNPRFISFSIIHDFLRSKKSHTLILDSYIKESLTISDRKLITHISKGVFRNKLLLDENIYFYSKVNNIDHMTRSLLYLGIFQIIFCDSIPNYAAVNTTIQIAEKKCKRSKSFINAILRKVSTKKIFFSDKDPAYKILDCPEWLYLKLVNEFNVGLINTYLDFSKMKPRIWLRINTLKVSISYVHKLFTKNKIKYKINEYLDNFLEVDKLDSNNIILNNIKLGLLYVQNPSSAFVIKYLNPKRNSKILDACSAPGGKASFMIQETSNSINLTCIEKNNSRLQILKSNMKALDFNNIKYINDDAGNINMKDKFDQILLDLPCSSTGTFSKNPDIKWKIDNKSILFFKKIQLKILLNMSKFLKIGGELLYSTCSLLKNENEDNIIEFLKINRNFSIVDIQNSLPSTLKNKLGGMTVMPDSNNYEGMFAVKLKKNDENIS